MTSAVPPSPSPPPDPTAPPPIAKNPAAGARIGGSGRDLTAGSVRDHLVRLTIPTIGGMLAMTIFNVTDTWFVSRLGTAPLAAMGFTFPVVMVVGTVANGLGLGSASVLARAMGQGDRSLMRRTATDGLLLAVAVVAVLGLVGLLTIDPLFTAMGASAESLPYVRDYMTIWYLGVIAVVMPPLGDGCLRATGDMVRPLAVMATCATVNAILDPILIFGYLGAPAMGVSGAALATIIARSIGMCLTLYFVYRHARLIDLSRPRVREVLASWRRILEVGLPAAMTNLLGPITRGVLVGLAAATGGKVAVAAMAAGSRVESFAMVLPIAFSTALVPMMGQNWGGGRGDRVFETRRYANRFAWGYGVLAWGLFMLAAPYLAAFFSADPAVIALTTVYLRIAAAGQAGLNLTMWTSMSFNAIGRPRLAALLNVIMALGLAIPGAWLGRYVAGFSGMLVGLVIGQTLAGFVALWLGGRILGHHSAADTPDPDAEPPVLAAAPQTPKG